MVIENIGLAMDTLETKNGIITGTATIYSKDEDGLELEYCDDFDFHYEIDSGFVNYSIDEEIFGDYLEQIDLMLIDNLKTNYLQTK